MRTTVTISTRLQVALNEVFVEHCEAIGKLKADVIKELIQDYVNTLSKKWNITEREYVLDGGAYFLRLKTICYWLEMVYTCKPCLIGV